jgi:hypothetical protein
LFVATSLSKVKEQEGEEDDAVPHDGGRPAIREQNIWSKIGS